MRASCVCMNSMGPMASPELYKFERSFSRTKVPHSVLFPKQTTRVLGREMSAAPRDTYACHLSVLPSAEAAGMSRALRSSACVKPRLEAKTSACSGHSVVRSAVVVAFCSSRRGRLIHRMRRGCVLLRHTRLCLKYSHLHRRVSLDLIAASPSHRGQRFDLNHVPSICSCVHGTPLACHADEFKRG